jgi:hypothetical protein
MKIKAAIITVIVLSSGGKPKANGSLYKSNFRRYAALLTKNYVLHIRHMLRRNFLLTPCLA